MERRRFDSRDERGTVLILVVMFAVVLMGVGALTIDLAVMRQNRTTDRRTADLVATAAAVTMVSSGGTAASACQAGWEYFRENVDDEGSSVSAPPCSSVFDAGCNSSAVRTATGTAGSYTVMITNPVPDSSTLMTKPDVVGGPTQAANSGIDGMPCQRIGVRIVHNTKFLFAGVLGLTDTTTDSHSVARPVSRAGLPGALALHLLDPDACNALTVSGQAQVIIHANDDKPGYINIDSSATGGSGTQSCTSGTRYAIDAFGTQNSKIIAEPGNTGDAGIIRMYALAQGQGNTRAYEAADVTAGRLSPQPTAAAKRLGRAPVDWTYNCTAVGYDGIWGTADDCARGTAPYIDDLSSQLGGSGAPAGYTRYPRTGFPLDSCSPPADVLPPGNYWVDCPSGFNVSTVFAFTSGDVVFQGGVSVGALGLLTLNQANSADSVVYIRNGNLSKGAQGSILLERSFVYLADGVMDLGGGAGPLTWVAPTGGNFKNLALWSESSSEQKLGGQANIGVEGVFFMPNARPFSFSGQGGQNQTRAQFITYDMSVSGQGTLEMAPDPERVLTLPAWGAALLR